jgi:hypothetical protein
VESIIALFDDKEKDEFKEFFNLSLGNVIMGMTPFQIRHFILNRREFPTDFAQFMQAKLELFQRVQLLNEMVFDYQKTEAEIDLAEIEIEELRQKEGKRPPIQIRLQEIEIAKGRLKLANIKKVAVDKLREAIIFLESFKKYEYFDLQTERTLAMAEEESWRIKSAYYPELGERYGLKPEGFVKLPHENGGLKVFYELA